MKLCKGGGGGGGVVVVVVIVLAMTHGHHLAKNITVDFGSNRQHYLLSNPTNHDRSYCKKIYKKKNLQEWGVYTTKYPTQDGGVPCVKMPVLKGRIKRKCLFLPHF